MLKTKILRTKEQLQKEIEFAKLRISEYKAEADKYIELLEEANNNKIEAMQDLEGLLRELASVN